ncbi:MAG: ribosome biogenesis GTPase YlqF [Clostridiales bacterium]|nr:ribosome biogenesis GTPase YlqF [Clostridiales bacterium]
MEQTKTIQWFPGHMAKTRRQIREQLKLVDAVAEIVDARIPAASRNPELAALVEGKPRIVVMTKADMADEAATRRWLAAFERQGTPAIAVDCKTGKGVGGFVPLLRGVLQDKIAAWQAKGMKNHPIRVMVVGIPNVGKSSFINRMARGGRAKVEDRPGVTRSNQWFVTDGGVQLLDTPGVLWPKFEDQQVAMLLAYTGAIRDEILDPEELAGGLAGLLRREYADRLTERYKLAGELPEDGYALLESIGRRRGMMVSGGEIDTERAAIMLLDEYRGGKLGRLTLEMPEEPGKDMRS